MAQKIVVSGGAGFIGSHIVRACLERGDEVHVIDTYAAPRNEARLDARAVYHEADVRQYDAIAPVIAGAAVIFHEAALPSVQFSIEHPLETFAVNVIGTLNVLRAAQEGGAGRVVAASSAAVYGDQAIMPLTERMTPAPKSPYGLHKQMLELLNKSWSELYCVPTVSLRYFNVYGPHMGSDGAYALAIAKFLRQRQEGKPITIWGDGSHTRDFVHVRDIARANLLAAQSPKVGKGEVLNIGSGRNTSVADLAALIGGPVVHEEERLEPRDALADVSLARELLGWSAEVPFEEGIAELKRLAGVA